MRSVDLADQEAKLIQQEGVSITEGPLREDAGMDLGLTWTWNGEINASNIIAIIAILLAVTTASFAYRQLSETARTNRARFLFDILKWYLDDKGLRNMFYRLDYGIWKFDVSTFPLSDDEPAIDHLLYVYDVIGYYIEIGALNKEELPIIRFEANQVLHNPEIVKYLTWLDSEYEKVGVVAPAYANARKLAGKITRP